MKGIRRSSKVIPLGGETREKKSITLWGMVPNKKRKTKYPQYKIMNYVVSG